MDVLDFAMKMEIDGRDFYKKGAAATKSPQIKKIFEMLAEEEHRHYHVFKKLKEGSSADASDLAPKGETVKNVKNVFREMIDAGKDTLEGDTTRDLWKEARDVEVKSEKMYRDAADETDDPTKKDMLNRIADEEQNHVFLVDNMISFLSAPEQFAQSQDYRTFKSWEGH